MQAVETALDSETSYFHTYECKSKAIQFSNGFLIAREDVREVLYSLMTRLLFPRERETATLIQSGHRFGKTFILESITNFLGGTTVTLDQSDYINSQNISQALLDSTCLFVDDLQQCHLQFFKGKQALLQGTLIQRNLKGGEVTNGIRCPPVVFTSNYPFISVTRGE